MPSKNRSNYKNQRFEGELRNELASIIRGIKDPRIPEMCTVVNVEASPDRSFATVFVSFLGEYNEIEVRRGLKSAKGFIRKKLGERMSIRVVPDLSFVIDKSMAHGARIDQLLSQINAGEHSSDNEEDAVGD